MTALMTRSRRCARLIWRLRTFQSTAKSKNSLYPPFLTCTMQLLQAAYHDKQAVQQKDGLFYLLHGDDKVRARSQAPAKPPVTDILPQIVLPFSQKQSYRNSKSGKISDEPTLTRRSNTNCVTKKNQRIASRRPSYELSLASKFINFYYPSC